jgi:hypothetical protein
MHGLREVHYLLAASLGILAGTLFDYTASPFWAFRNRVRPIAPS